MFDVLSQGPIFLVTLIFMLGVVVIIHELGHYLVGRFFGAAVESFSVGFGSPLFERKDRNGTRWRVNWIPLGGFVKFVGESQLAGDVGKVEQGPVGKPYNELGVGARSLVAVAGPVANFVLATVIFAFMLQVQGRSVEAVSISAVTENGPAAIGGLQPGDRIEAINGSRVESRRDFLLPIQLGTGENLRFTVLRDGETVDLFITPRRGEAGNGLGQTYRVGMIQARPQWETIGRKTYNPFSAIVGGLVETGETISMTGNMLGRMVTGREPISNLSGPVGIGDTSRRVVNRTLGATHLPLSERVSIMFWMLVNICALVSVGIGLFNLLPLPVLDGGHLVFNAYEAATGKALPEKVQEASLTFGLILLIGVAVVVTWGDILETGLLGS